MIAWALDEMQTRIISRDYTLPAHNKTCYQFIDANRNKLFLLLQQSYFKINTFFEDNKCLSVWSNFMQVCRDFFALNIFLLLIKNQNEIIRFNCICKKHKIIHNFIKNLYEEKYRNKLKYLSIQVKTIKPRMILI